MAEQRYSGTKQGTKMDIRSRPALLTSRFPGIFSSDDMKFPKIGRRNDKTIESGELPLAKYHISTYGSEAGILAFGSGDVLRKQRYGSASQGPLPSHTFPLVLPY